MNSRHVVVLLAVGLAGCGVPDAVQSDFDFEREAFTFVNFGTDEKGGHMTLSLAARMFGREAVCLNGEGPCEGRPQAIAWVSQVNETLLYGHSEGLSVLAQLMHLGRVSPSDFGAERASGLAINDALADELAYWAATQSIESVHAHDEGFAAKDVMPFLAKALKPGNAEAFRLLVAIRDENTFKAGHGLVPFGYFKGDRDGLYYLRVYDSNMPQAEQRLEIDTTANTWRYEGGVDPLLPRSYVGNAANGNLLWFSPVTQRTGVLPAPFAADAPLAFVASQATLLIEGEGATIGFRDGALLEQGGHVRPASANACCGLPSEIISVSLNADAGTGAQTVKLTGNPGATQPATVNVSGGGVSVSVSGAQVTGSPDLMVVDTSAKTVTYNSGQDGPLTITTTVPGADGGTRTITVTVSDASKSITVDASNPDDIRVGVDDAPSGTTVTVTVSEGQAGADGGMRSTTATATTTGNDVKVGVQPSTGGTTVDTSVNFETCLNNKKDMDESDIDCGAACGMADKHVGTGKCGLARVCTADADCDNGNCLGGRCLTPTCSDSKKNGGETDVDCGVSGCPCGSGKACTGSQNCVTSARCLTNVCVSPGMHTLLVQGLPLAKKATVNSLIDGAFKTDQLVGRSASFTWPISALERFWVAPQNAASDDARCALARETSAGMWEWNRLGDAGVGNQQNTLNCALSSAPLNYVTNGDACPVVISGSFLDGLSPEIGVTGVNGARLTGAYLYTARTPVYLTTIPYAPPGQRAYDVSVSGPQVRLLRLLNGQRRNFREACTVLDAGSRQFPASGQEVVTFGCRCDELDPDGGVIVADAGVDAGVDAGIDAGVVDAGSGAALGATCSADTDCAARDCWCATTPGNCAGAGRCGAVRTVVSTPTSNGVASSGTFTVPTSCLSVAVRAWGAAGGSGATSLGMGMSAPTQGGAGGYVAGTVTVAAGDVFTMWVGSVGSPAGSTTSQSSVGSYFGVAANGGQGDGLVTGDRGGGGGGLSSVQLTGANSMNFVVPGGSGAGAGFNGVPAGGTGAGSGSGRAGGSATASSKAGGGGAGSTGGLAGSSFSPGDPGAFGAPPFGFANFPGTGSTPSGTSGGDYSLCPSGTGDGSSSNGNGCFVLRCVYP